MISRRRLFSAGAAVLLASGLAACSSPSGSSSSSAGSSAAGGDWTPITIEHALGTTTVEQKPERVATVGYANQEAPLALGIVPVGMARSDFGDDNGDGVMPWVEESLKKQGAKTPPMFDETDGIDFEAVANTKPDLILAPYSGLSQEDYDTLTEIAPVVAYPEEKWGTPWRESILISSKALGKGAEGKKLVADLEQDIAEGVAKHPNIKGKSAMFLTHIDSTDLSKVSFYSANDTRVKYLEDLGMTIPASVKKASAGTDSYSVTQSAETVDTFEDVDSVITYGGTELITALEKDPILSKMPAVANDAFVNLPGDKPIGTGANPTALSIPYLLDDYLTLLDKAVTKGK